VTVEQLLTHTSGVTSYRDFARARPEISRDELLAWIAQQPLDAEPGACFEYSESNVLLAAAIVEHAADMPLESALGALVFEPFALERWSWAPFEPSIRGRFEVDLIGDALAVDPPWAHVGAGTPRANLRELVQLASALWHRGATGADELPILGADVSLPDGSKPPLAWGWTRSRAGPRAELSFGGRSGDSRIHVTAVPDVELVVALASSRSNESLDALARKLVRAVLEEPQAEVLDLETPDDERAACTGAYYVGCTRIAIEERGDALWLVPPAENAYRLRFQGAHRFVSAADVDVRIEFEVRDARATGFVIDVRGSRMYARRVE
jgi:CubicO group peptidase (beta-lactamase class C family)